MTTGASDTGALVQVALYGGGSLTLWPDRLEVVGASYPVADIAWAGLVNDPKAPQGVPPAPAVAWRMAHGEHAAATPADPPQAWQILEALFTQRPDLRTPLPPPAPPAGQPGWGAPPPYGYPPAYGVYPPYGFAQRSNDNQTVMAGLAHLSMLFGAPWVALILWLVNRQNAPYAAQQSKRAFFFQLVVIIVEFVAMAIFFVIFFASMFTLTINTTSPEPQIFTMYGGIIVFDIVVFAIQITAIVFAVIASVQAFQGKPYHYPLMGRI